MQTLAAVAKKTQDELSLDQVSLAEVQADEVIVAVRACGVCHMDIEARKLMPLPCIMGHEAAGVVFETGSAVSNVQPGDRVILGYGFCGQCTPCRQQQPYFCDESWSLTFSGRRADGSSTVSAANGEQIAAAFFQQSSFAQHAITPARSLVKIADDIPWHIAAAIPCGFLTGAGTALNVLDVQDRDTVLIRGAGAVGIGAIVAAKKRGCRNIVASDIVADRLSLAEEFGATAVVNAADEDFDSWRERNMPRGFTRVLDTTGNAAVFENSIESLATGGTMAYAILPSPMEEFSFRPFELFVKCATLKAVSFGSAVPADLLPEMLEWWRSGDFPVEKLISTFDFADIGAALDAGASGKVIKPVVVMPE